MSHSFRPTLIPTLAVAALLAACTGEPATGASADAALTIYGAGSAAAAAPAFTQDQLPPGAETGAAGSVKLNMYALWVSRSADCSNPVLVQQYPAAGVEKDFMQHPVLFSGSPDPGAYQCVMFRMSDVLRMSPAATFGSCVLGTEYSGDIYRDGESDWVDVNLNPIIGHGTEAAPVDDHVTLFMSRNPAAVEARGASEHQTLPLGSDLVVPAHSTFVMDASHSVMSYQGQCGMNPPAISFQ
jgi:hypothetical protein